MKIYNVTLEEWSEEQAQYVEYQRQYLGETEEEATEEAEEENPRAAVLYASEIGDAQPV